jgi:hypothetical protein
MNIMQKITFQGLSIQPSFLSAYKKYFNALSGTQATVKI